nr:ATP-binding protein [Agromyces laixinhei]
MHRLRRQAGLAQPAADIADIKVMPGRSSMDTELIARLAIGSYLIRHHDVILQGPTGAGKTYVASALGNKACQQHRRVLYLPADELFDRITIAERAGDKKRCLDTLVKVELLIIDDWFLTTPTRPQVQQLHTLIDRRHKTASTIYCTQLAPGQWHDRMDEKRSSPTPSSTGSLPTRTRPSFTATTPCAGTSPRSTEQPPGAGPRGARPQRAQRLTPRRCGGSPSPGTMAHLPPEHRLPTSVISTDLARKFGIDLDEL